MDTRQTLNIVDRYFNTFEVLGTASLNDYVAILYLMFIDEYYEFNRDISFKDIDNDEIGLTDCLVRKLNTAIECLKTTSDILKGVELDYLPTKNHWIIPDVEPEDNWFVEDRILYTTDYVDNKILYTDGTINNKILQP